MKPQTFWFIGYTHRRGGRGIYGGGSGFSTRRAAILDHERNCNLPWKELKRGGDFAVKCVVTPAGEGGERG
jgi:hypothetical protein